MNSFYLTLTVFLFILCKVNSQLDDNKIHLAGPQLKELSLPKNKDINTVIESFINALHPVEESPDQVIIVPLKDEDDKQSDQVHYQLTADALSELTDEDLKEVLKNNGIVDLKNENTEEDNKFIRPLILSLLSNQSSNHIIFSHRKPSRRPRLPNLRLKPKFNLTHLIKYRSTVRPNWVLPNDMDKNEQTSSAPIHTDRVTSSIVKAKTSDPMMTSKKPLYGPYNMQWPQIDTTDAQNNDPSHQTTKKTIDEDFEDDYLELDDFIEKTTPVSTDSQFNLADMIRKINMLINLQSTTTETNLPRLLYNDIDGIDHDEFKIDQSKLMSKLNLDKLRNELRSNELKSTKKSEFNNLNELDEFIINKMDDSYVPVKLDLPSALTGTDVLPTKSSGNSSKIQIGHNIDLETMIGKISSIMASSAAAAKTTIQPTTSSIDTTSSQFDQDDTYTDFYTERSQKVVTRKSRFTTVQTYGPVYQKMPDTIIGPMLNPVDQKSTVPSVGDEAYSPITLSKFKNPINSLLYNKIFERTTDQPENEQNESVPANDNGVPNQSEKVNVNEQIQSSEDINGTHKELGNIGSGARKRRFPWAYVLKRRELSSTTVQSIMSTDEDSDDVVDSLYREIEEEENEYQPIKYNPIMTQSENMMTTRVKPFVEIMGPTFKPSILSWGIKPLPTAKIPDWLQLIFKPKATTDLPNLKDTTKGLIFIAQNVETANRVTQNPIGKDMVQAQPESLNYGHFGREGNHVGSHSGQSWNGIGYNNGQGGIVIGSNSGNGKRPPKRPVHHTGEKMLLTK